MSTTERHARALAALGHEARLSIFRRLVRAGEGGLAIGAIGTATGLAPSTLAHHLSTLVDADLVMQEKRGRSVINRANYVVLDRLTQFLREECCADANTETAA